METLLALVGALLVRIGPPLLLTLLFTWVLRALDRRWQAEANERLPAQEMVYGPGEEPIPCWLARGCSEERRSGCPAYRTRGVPCWQHFRDKRGYLRQECLLCEVFRWAPVRQPLHSI